MSFRAAFLALGLAAWATPALAGITAARRAPTARPIPITAPTGRRRQVPAGDREGGREVPEVEDLDALEVPAQVGAGRLPRRGGHREDRAGGAEGHGEDHEGLRRRRRPGRASELVPDPDRRRDMISSCVLSQHNAIRGPSRAERDRHLDRGLAAPGIDNKARSKCIARGVEDRHRPRPRHPRGASKCIDKQIKAGTAGDLAPICVGSIAAGQLRPAERREDRLKIGKLLSSAQSRIQKKCGAGEGSWLPSVFACDGAGHGGGALRVPELPGLPERGRLRRAAVRRAAALSSRTARTPSRPRSTRRPRARSS